MWHFSACCCCATHGPQNTFLIWIFGTFQVPVSCTPRALHGAWSVKCWTQHCNFEWFAWSVLILWVLGMKTCHLESAVWTAKWCSGYSCCSQEMHFLQKCQAVFPRSLNHVAILNVFPDWSSGWKPVTWSLLFELRNDVRATQEQVREEMHCLQECLPFVW